MKSATLIIQSFIYKISVENVIRIEFPNIEQMSRYEYYYTYSIVIYTNQMKNVVTKLSNRSHCRNG